MAQTGSWASIVRHGLLSTKALLDLFEVEGRRRTEILTRRRGDSIVLEHAVHGRAVLRDQKPLSESKLEKCLQDGISPQEWIEMLNSRVFFWVDPGRLTILRDAKEYRAERQLVLRVDTRELVEAYAGRIQLTDRNTGTTNPFAHPRGRKTFLPIEVNGGRRVVELTVLGGIPDFARFVISASEIGGGRPDELIFSR